MTILEVAAEHPSPSGLKLCRCGVKTSTTYLQYILKIEGIVQCYLEGNYKQFKNIVILEVICRFVSGSFYYIICYLWLNSEVYK